ncbi:hypothetical protein [Vibrio owensii]|uniref:hypothetical protein n=1 Tax=Vibrio owensii TaxID=696485 RepID=UPI002220403A|nr:hypothetical protein [Vibrio owensii]
MRSDDPVGLTGDTEKRTPTEIAIIEEGNQLVAHKLGVVECPHSLIDKALRALLSYKRKSCSLKRKTQPEDWVSK